jgi:protein involved in polysaccharide export with SLBB domain
VAALESLGAEQAGVLYRRTKKAGSGNSDAINAGSFLPKGFVMFNPEKSVLFQSKMIRFICIVALFVSLGGSFVLASANAQQAGGGGTAGGGGQAGSAAESSAANAAPAPTAAAGLAQDAASSGQTAAPGTSRQAPAPNGLTEKSFPCSSVETFLTQSSLQMSPGQSSGPSIPTLNPLALAAVKENEIRQEQVQQITQPSPYFDIASLRQMYVQVPFSGARLERFGCDSFMFGTGNANELPIDIPVGPDFVLGPGDNIVINMWGGMQNRLTETIDRQGKVTLPEAGTLTVNGMTVALAQSAIQALLNTQYKDEHVELSLGRVRTVRIYVVGDVQRPGAYDVSSLTSPLGALFAAGGPTSRGSLRVLRQYRGKNLEREIDLYDFLLKGVRAEDRLLPGDTLLVSPVGAEVTVEGMVHRPAIYELNGEQTLDQVLNLAGGVLATASLKKVKVQRVVAHERRTMLSLDLSGDPAQVQKQLASFKVEGGDDVVIAQILPYTENAVFLDGHIYRPGLYPYTEGMTVSDLVHSYQDVLPEPSDLADLVRLVPPDYHPEVMPFNLRDVLVGNVSIPLQPYDLIRVYGRYQEDAPTVTIQGDVLRPRTYPLSQGMTVSALLKMAGGFSRSAYRAEADLSSYDVQNGQKVLVNHSEVAVEKALDGDRNADVVLHPGDVLSIRRLEGWQDIGAMVTINGEVGFAGAYSINPGERLSSVLKRAGGFREDAYPPAAILERQQVRELAEQARQQMIHRIENTPIDFKPGTMAAASAGEMEQALQQQRAQALAALRNEPASGRLVINISSDMGRWENTAADIELRSGDILTIPKRPNFVIVSGQVFNPGAISYVPGKSIMWYLSRTGGPTRLADKKTIYVLHADGSVTPRTESWMASGFAHMRMRPGDDIFVPEKVMGGSQLWQNIIGIAQVMSAAALPLAISGTL